MKTFYLLEACSRPLGLYESEEKAREAAQTALTKGASGWPTGAPSYSIVPLQLNQPPNRCLPSFEVAASK